MPEGIPDQRSPPAAPEHGCDVERVGGHGELAVLVAPGTARPVGIHLDAEPVGVGQIERLADEMVGHAGPLADFRQMAQEAPERGPVGQQDREVVQPQPAAPRDRRGARTLVQLDQRRGAPGPPRRATRPGAVERLQTEDPPIPLERARQIRHLQADRAQPSRGGEAVARWGDAIGLGARLPAVGEVSSR